MKQNFLKRPSFLIVLGLLAALPTWAEAAPTTTPSSTPSAKQGAPGARASVREATTITSTVRTSHQHRARFVPVRTVRPPTSRTTARTRRYVSPWDTPTYADSTFGDVVDGEDQTVRHAAVSALGPYNGSVVVADPNTGRILSLVNQKLAITGAYQPCSTIKLVAGLAGLSEGIIERTTRLRLSRRESVDLTMALAKSNNAYFANVGEKLGFPKINYYGRLFGLGERAGLDIPGESPGIFPEEKPKSVPAGMMTSFGETIGITPLQLAAIVSTIANGGTLYYLQYPHNQLEATAVEPRAKRKLDIAAQIPEMLPGMMGAVDFGTARRANYDEHEPIFGKTGTCTDARTHLGWFGSFNEVGSKKLVVVVLLTGGKGVNGPVAAGIAGQVYKNLSDEQFFAQGRGATPAVLVEGDSH